MELALLALKWIGLALFACGCVWLLFGVVEITDEARKGKP